MSTAGRVGLVLGAGGATGAAFHAGTLLALQHDLGWDPNSADVIVGSSAGSIIGALLRAGLSTDDLAAWGSSVEALPAGRVSRRTLELVGNAGSQLVPSFPRPRVVSPALWRSLLPPSRLRVHTALFAMLPDGWLDAGSNLEQLGRLLEAWPEDRLWLTAVGRRDGRRVVFGRDDIAVTPGQAVAASCAVPGVFTPVTVGERRYIDGGAHSPTNADLLLDAGVDTAIVLSPMSAPWGAIGWRSDRVVRSMCRRVLSAECEQLAGRGIAVHVFEPDAATLRSMGANPLDDSKAPSVVRESFLAAGAWIAAHPAVRASLSRQPVTRTAVPPRHATTKVASARPHAARC